MTRALTPLRIGDVARLLNVDPHVIRHWESVFYHWLHITRGRRSRQRWYTPSHVATLIEIRRLLHVELFTTEGARRQLRLAAERERQTE